MCLHGNKALLSAEYLTSQLRVKWTNAETCAKSEGSESKSYVEFRNPHHDESYYAESRYTRALAEFHFAGRNPPNSISKDALFFSASFGEPKLEFICNHEAALCIKLKEARFSRTYPANTSLDTARLDAADFDTVNDVEVTFRVAFSRSVVTVNQEDVTGHNMGLIHLVVFNFLDVQPVIFAPVERIASQKALEFYLREYLKFLHNAGHHVFFDLPNFGDKANINHSPHIDHSLTRKESDIEKLSSTVSVFGTHVSAINSYLRETWLSAACSAKGIFDSHPKDPLSFCLAEVRSTWVEPTAEYLHIKFYPPRIQALCRCEVVLYFTIEAISFDAEDEALEKPTGIYKDWVFAFVVNVVEVKEAEITHLDFDFSTARYCEHLSQHASSDAQTAEFVEQTLFFLSETYIQILQLYRYALYRHSSRSFINGSGFIGNDSEWIKGYATSQITDWQDIVQTTQLSGYDYLTALSEQSVSALFSFLCTLNKNSKTSHELLVGWSLENKFSASFEPIRVKLLSDEAALITFTISKGEMLGLEGHEHGHSFSDWSVSYRVPVVGESSTEGTTDYLRKWPDSHIAKRYGKGTQIHHICLDLQNATYIPEHSLMPGLWDESNYGVMIARLSSIATHMKLYMAQLVENGYHVIHSTPIFPTAENRTSITSVTFQVVSETEVNTENCMMARQAPVIMVLGVSQGRIPAGKIPWLPTWAISGQTTRLGTLCLSKATFLESRLLRKLAAINAQTTVMTRFPKEDESDLGVYLTTWDQNTARRSRSCNWKLSNTTADALEYVWKYRDEWSYEHEWTHEEAGGFAVSCQTKNTLCIPTTYHPQQLDILLQGQSVLMIIDREQASSWRRCCATWALTISLYTEAGGLRVYTASEEVKPVFGDVESQGEWSTELDPHKLLLEHFPRVISVADVVEQLEEVLTNHWEYSFGGMQAYSLGSPVFTSKGDIILQLRPHLDVPAGSTKLPQSPRPRISISDAMRMRSPRGNSFKKGLLSPVTGQSPFPGGFSPQESSFSLSPYTPRSASPVQRETFSTTISSMVTGFASRSLASGGPPMVTKSEIHDGGQVLGPVAA